MPKLESKAAVLFKKNTNSEFVEAYEEREIAQASPNFRQEFVAASLSQAEDNAIQRLLCEQFKLETEEEDVGGDYQALLVLTQQIRAIDRQSILLHGERIQKAQVLLKKYRDGAFTSWLALTYGNRQTPYRILRFYELFQELERQDRELLEKMPKKAAYSLAMREGDMRTKVDIIRRYHNEKPEWIIETIRERLPLPHSDRRGARKSHDDTILEAIEKGIRTLKKRKEELAESTKNRLKNIYEEIAGVLQV